MSDALITPSILKWARERSHLTLELCAELLKVKVDKLIKWEDGTKKPTFNQAHTIAQKLQIPFGYLFLKEPPKEQLEIPDLRTFKNQPIKEISADFRSLIKNIKAKQEWYKDYVLENDLPEKLFLQNFTIHSNETELIENIKKLLNLNNYIAKSLPKKDMLNNIVNEIEKLGILVMKNGIVGSNTYKKLDLNEFRGFAIYDKFAPLIFINSTDSISAQIFTLLHEIIHLWIGEGGISLLNFEETDNDIELFCNQITGKILVPTQLLNYHWNSNLEFEEHYENLATIFSVSTLVILNRLYNLKYIDYSKYLEFTELEQYKFSKIANIKKKNNGGNFYDTLKTKVGSNFSYALIESTLEGRTSYKEASNLLGMSYSNIKQYATKLGMINYA